MFNVHATTKVAPQDLPMATFAATFDAEQLKGKSESELLAWAKAGKELWEKVKEAIGADESSELEDLSDVAPEDYEAKIHELTEVDNLKPMQVAKLFKLVNAIRVSQGLAPAELKPLSAKKARVAAAPEKNEEPIGADPPLDVPGETPTFPAGQLTQVGEVLVPPPLLSPPETPNEKSGGREEQGPNPSAENNFGITPPHVDDPATSRVHQATTPGTTFKFLRKN